MCFEALVLVECAQWRQSRVMGKYSRYIVYMHIYILGGWGGGGGWDGASPQSRALDIFCQARCRLLTVVPLRSHALTAAQQKYDRKESTETVWTLRMMTAIEHNTKKHENFHGTLEMMQTSAQCQLVKVKLQGFFFCVCEGYIFRVLCFLPVTKCSNWSNELLPAWSRVKKNCDVCCTQAITYRLLPRTALST